MSNNRFKPLECRGTRLTGRAGFFDPSKLPEGASPEDEAEAERLAYRQMKAQGSRGKLEAQQRRQ